MKMSPLFRMTLNIAIPALLLTFGLGAKKQAAVRATLQDGQVLYGDIRTQKLTLSSDLGDLKIPLKDIGEVVPIEGDEVGDADRFVRVWLRDGSELVGQWQEPELAMSIAVGKDDVRLDLPADQLMRLQTQGGEVWPRGAVYRVRTIHGDDFLVDARDSRFTLQNDLGEFSPTLADCISVRPIDDPEGDWRVELGTGTVLIGTLKGNQLTLAMPMGPETVTVPLASFDSMEQQSWATAGNRRDTSVLQIAGGRGGKRSTSAGYSSWEDQAAVAAPAPDVEMVVEESDDARADGWFQRHSLERAKQAAN